MAIFVCIVCPCVFYFLLAIFCSCCQTWKRAVRRRRKGRRRRWQLPQPPVKTKTSEHPLHPWNPPCPAWSSAHRATAMFAGRPKQSSQIRDLECLFVRSGKVAAATSTCTSSSDHIMAYNTVFKGGLLSTLWLDCAGFFTPLRRYSRIIYNNYACGMIHHASLPSPVVS